MIQAQDEAEAESDMKEDTPVHSKIGRFLATSVVAHTIQSAATTTMNISSAVKDVAIKGAALSRIQQK